MCYLAFWNVQKSHWGFGGNSWCLFILFKPTFCVSYEFEWIFSRFSQFSKERNHPSLENDNFTLLLSVTLPFLPLFVLLLWIGLQNIIVVMAGVYPSPVKTLLISSLHGIFTGLKYILFSHVKNHLYSGRLGGSVG